MFRGQTTSGRVRWSGVILIVVALGFVAGGILWVTRPQPAPTDASPRAESGPKQRPAAEAAAPSGPVPGLAAPTEPEANIGTPVSAGFSPVRVLVITGGSFTVEICDLSTQSVLIRWYTMDDPPQLDSTQTVTVNGKATLPMKTGMTPTAQTKGQGGRMVGVEVGINQQGSCP